MYITRWSRAPLLTIPSEGIVSAPMNAIAQETK
jgi:hypothetical protein